ncbi:MAG TPA: DNA-binding response regulator [Clostridiales bacterium]|nr:DNA-binding response regulator [Clostridiales bacterium]
MRLLLAEDEVILSRALVAILKHNNYSVDAVFDGETALEYLRTGLYDGAILDIMMPKMDGLTVLKTARSENINIPVLILTAKSEPDDKVTGLDSGADDYLSKPFNTPELLARIRAMLRRKTDPIAPDLTFGDITLNRTTFELTGPTDTLRLSNKEFQMMEMLMIKPGNLISTERFMEKIWGYDSESELNVVWAYISYLRRKLSLIGSTVQIKAVRNLGYLLETKE